MRGSETDAWLAAGYLGLAGGLRQSLLLLLFPLWLISVMVGVRRARVLVISGAVLILAVLAWFVPMIWLTGGLERYLDASRHLADTVVKPTSILGGPLEVTLRMSRYLLESVLVALGPLAVVVLLVPWYVRRHGWGQREWFLLAWMVPPVLVYTLVHFGQAGYVLTFLPALVILLSRVLLAALARVAERVPRVWVRGALAATAVMLIVLANGGFFVSARPLARDFDTRQPAWLLARPRRGVRLDLQPHGGRPARARGGDAHVRGSDPRPLPARGHRDPHRARQRALVPVAPSRDVLSAGVRRSTSCGSATSHPATTHHAWPRR